MEQLPLSPFYPSSFLLWMLGFLVAQYNYQTISYLVEEQENLLSTIHSYTCFGVGMSIGSIVQYFTRLPKVKKQLAMIFFFAALYYCMKWFLFGWIEDSKMTFSNAIALTYFDKTVLAFISGLYLPLIYELLCGKHEKGHRGTMCGIIEFCMALAEMVAPWGVLMLINYKVNFLFFIVGLIFVIPFIFILNKEKVFK